VHVDGLFRRKEADLLDERQLRLIEERPAEVQEWLLEVVIRLGRYLVVLQVLLAMEGNLFGLDLSILNINLVTTDDDGDPLADSREVFVPIGYVLVTQPRSDIEEDDGSLSGDIIAIAQPSELLLASGIPDVEHDRTVAGIERDSMHVHPESGDVLHLEIAGEVSPYEGRLACPAVSHDH